MPFTIEVAMRGVRTDTAEALREYVQRKLSSAIRPFSRRVRGVTVRFVDENGPRRGVDSRCSMTAEQVDGGRLFVEATAAWPFAAAAQAAARLSEVLRRQHRPHAHAASRRAFRRDDH